MRTLAEILQGEDGEEFAARASISFDFFSKRVLGLEFSPFHLEWVSMAENSKRVGIAAPTGFAKTTVLGMAYPLWKILGGRFDTLVVSKTMPQSLGILDQVVWMVKDNEFLMGMVPEIGTWSSRDMINPHIRFRNGSKYFCRPNTDSVRGVHVHYVLADEVSSYKDFENFKRYVVTRANARKGTVCAITTLKSLSDLMASYIMRNPEWSTKVYRALEDGKSIWEARFPTEYLLKLQKEDSDSFEREYQSNVAVAGNTLIKAEDILDMAADNMDFTEKTQGRVYIGCDLARSAGKYADWLVFFAVEDSPFPITIERVVNGEKFLRKVEKPIIIRNMLRKKGIQPEQQKSLIRNWHRMYPNAKINIDESLWGSMIVDELRNEGLPVAGCPFQSTDRLDYLKKLKVCSGRLVIPTSKEAFPLTQHLISELSNMTVSETLQGNETIVAKTGHDDAVMSLALAVKDIVSMKPIPKLVAFAL